MLAERLKHKNERKERWNLKHKAMIGVIVILSIFPACSSGVRYLGKMKMPNGETRTYVQIGSKGHDSPRITVIESFQGGKLQTSYQASGRGMIEVVVDGPVRDFIAAGGKLGAAALLRPSKVTVTQSGGGAVSSAKGGTGQGGSAEANTESSSGARAEGGNAESVSNAVSEQTSILNSEQIQTQEQGQEQNQEQGQEQAQEQEQVVE